MVEEGTAPSTIHGTISTLKYQLQTDGRKLELNSFLLSVMISASEIQGLRKRRYVIRFPLSENLLLQVGG